MALGHLLRSPVVTPRLTSSLLDKEPQASETGERWPADSSGGPAGFMCGC